jgi:UDP-N-acetylmuramoylalanine--D-glutamate ligase
MKDWESFFKGKKVTVMGLGLLGRGVGDVKFLAEMGAEIIVTDLKKADELKASIEKLSQKNLGKAAERVTFILGRHQLEDFRHRDFILKAAGVPIDSPYIAEARKNGIPVEMSTALFATFAMKEGLTIVGITGTRGKSTVTELVYQILQKATEKSAGRLAKKSAKKTANRTIFLGGNVRGVATLPLLADIKKGDIAVLELDSWQLQGFAERRISPRVSVFTTFLADHQNYYKRPSMSAEQATDLYLDDKAAIFKYQAESDYLILGSQAEPIVRKKYGSIIKSKIIVSGAKMIPPDWKIQIPGEHNRYNIALAVDAARAVGEATKHGGSTNGGSMNSRSINSVSMSRFLIDEQLIKKTVENFKGVPGRLELIGEIKGVKIYNDTTATTSDATIAALEALGNQGRIILIAGGADKGLDMTKLVEVMPKFCKKVILLPGSGTDKLRLNKRVACEDVANIGKPFAGDANTRTLFVNAADLEDAVTKAIEAGERGDIIILSPAFASFGAFKNEFDRGEQFLKIINSL